MNIKRLASSISVQLQATAIFLSFVGIGFGVKTYLHVQEELGAEVAETFFADLMWQLLIALIVNIGVAYVLYQITTKPINRLSEVMRSLTQNDLDIEVPYVAVPSQIGSMARKVLIFKKNAIAKLELEQQQKLNEIRAQEEKKQAMEALAARFESEVSGIIRDVSAEVISVKKLAEQMVGMMNSASEKAGGVSTAAEETSQNVNNVAGAAEEMSSSVREVAQQIFKSSESVKAAVSANQSANHTAAKLEEAAQKIGDIVHLIQSIASQINLLALNATIESARAGEAGKGFAVVAGEVKNLAAQTSKATDDIASQVVNIQDVSKQVMEALGTIDRSITQVDHVSASISLAINQQSTATDEIAKNINGAASRSQRISSDIQDVTRSSGDASQCASDALQAVNILSTNTARLNAALDGFLRNIRAA